MHMITSRQTPISAQLKNGLDYGDCMSYESSDRACGEPEKTRALSALYCCSPSSTFL